jgi:hypothetical protein
MGYKTEVVGKLNLNKELDEDTYTFLVKFNKSRRIARNLSHEYGIEGEFFVDEDDYSPQDDTIIDFNRPPKTQPSLWCDWRPSEDRKSIEWDGQEKFYEYESWIAYILENFLIPKGYTLTGTVEFQGENIADHGWLTCNNNRIWIDYYQ